MKRITSLLVGLLFSVQSVAATFAPHQILTATDLNNALSNAAITSGTISGATISTSPISGSTGAFTTLASPSVSLTGGLIDGVSLGTITPASGSFTTLAASSTVSGTGFSTYLASPPAIGGTVPAAGSFTNLSSSGTVSGTGFSTYLASPPAIGGTVPAAGSFTTLAASSTVSGTGFSTYLASPPAIGGTVPAAGSFTTVTSTVATGTPPLTVTSTTPVTNLSIGGNAATATSATNLAGGSGGAIPYQSAAGTTAMLANGTAGQLLQSGGGTAAPSWVTNFALSAAPLRSVSASVATNALTLTLNATSLSFRSTTLNDGSVNTRTMGAAASITVASGATLGTANGVASRLMLLAIDNAGTVELAVVNLSGAPSLDETTLISTTALSGTSNSATVIYSTTARTNVPFRVVGYIDITEATAGTWATAPTTVQGSGGEALTRSPVQSMVRLNTANGYGSTNTKIRRFTNVVVNQGSDITYTDSATLGASFTINVSGVYAISYNDQFSNNSFFGISLNSTQLTTGIDLINVGDILAISGWFSTTFNISAFTGVTIYLPSGSIIRAHTDGVSSGTTVNACQFTITRVN